MKVIYEFNEKEDTIERNLFENSRKMYLSLVEIETYIKSIKDGFMEEDFDKALDTISEYIYDSGIKDIQ